MISTVFSIEGVGRSRRPPVEALSRADWRAELTFRSEDLALLQLLAPQTPVTGGAVHGSLLLEGDSLGPEITLRLNADQLIAWDRPPVGLDVSLDTRDDHFLLSGVATDEVGDWIVFDVDADTGLDVLAAGIRPETLYDARWGASVIVSERPLHTVNLPFDGMPDLPATLALRADFSSEASAPPVGDLSMRVSTHREDSAGGSPASMMLAGFRSHREEAFRGAQGSRAAWFATVPPTHPSKSPSGTSTCSGRGSTATSLAA